MPFMLIDDPTVEKLLHAAVYEVRTETCLHDDLYQEACLHFCHLERKLPGQELRSYLKRCRHYLKNFLRHGRSLDSPKRSHLRTQLDDEFDDECPQAEWLSSDGQIFSSVSAHNLRDQLLRRLPSLSDRAILGFLDEGLSRQEIAGKLHTSCQAVSNGLKRIRTAALRLGFRPPGSQQGASP